MTLGVGTGDTGWVSQEHILVFAAPLNETESG